MIAALSDNVKKRAKRTVFTEVGPCRAKPLTVSNVKNISLRKVREFILKVEKDEN